MRRRAEREDFIGRRSREGMSDLGKVAPEFFADHIRPYLGADRDDVRLGPTHGVDFGVVDVGDAAVAVATDPVSVLPDLGFERAGRFALHVVLADVAVSGLTPSHLAIAFTLPPEMEDGAFARVWRAIDAEATELGVSVVTGHTARYAGCAFPWVGGATAFAVGDPADLVRPDGARPGDDLLVTKGPAVETTGLLTTLFPEQFDLPAATLADAQARLDEASCVRDATTAAAAGPVTAMHDATEGGVHGALVEMAASAGVRFDVDRSAIPVRPGVRETCAALGIDPWAATTSGSLVVTVDSAGTDAVRSALEARGTPVAHVGQVREGDGVYVDGERIEHPRIDPSWEAYDRLARQARQA
jgi:hydrogenase maturation factor